MPTLTRKIAPSRKTASKQDRAEALVSFLGEIDD